MPKSKASVIYVRLLDEGTEVWRPVEAVYLVDDVFRITGSRPEDESWEFQPGDAVHCEHHKLSGGKKLTANRKALGD